MRRLQEHSGGFAHRQGQLVCCNKPMVLLVENTVDAYGEKHVPVISRDGDKVKVSVGSVPHPMEEKHYIEWAVSINKQNLTHEYITQSKVFTVSVLSQQAPLPLIGQFGFKSGREFDKFAEVNYRLTAAEVPYVTDHVLAYVEAKVIREVDAGTHTLFSGK